MIGRAAFWLGLVWLSVPASHDARRQEILARLAAIGVELRQDGKNPSLEVALAALFPAENRADTP